MKNIFIAGLIIGLMIIGMVGPASAETYTFLNDYAVTGNSADVVHLGDEYRSDFIVPTAEGFGKSFYFDLSADGVGDLSLTISHYNAIGNGWNEIYLNSHQVGILLPSPDDLSSGWSTETFTYSGSILTVGSNNLFVSTAYDDFDHLTYDEFEFTNFKMDYAVAPEPISSTLFLVGGATLGFRRLRKRVS